MRGTFIVLEGVDGSGKSKQGELLIDYLLKNDIPLISTREPGGTDIGEEIRNLLLTPAHVGMDPRTEFFLYAASRAQWLRDVVEPSLEKGITIVADRYDLSSAAYQGAGRQLGIDKILHVSRAFGFRLPDRIYFFDLPLETAKARMHKAGKQLDRIEGEHDEFFERTREGYHKTFARPEYHDIVRTIDAALDIETIHRKVIADVQSLYPDKFPFARPTR